MQRIEYKVTTISPVLIAENVKNTNIVFTSDYIPGNVIIGMLVKNLIEKRTMDKEAHQNLQFYSWFLKGDVIITNANILSTDKNNVEYSNFPIPYSIRKKKEADDIIDLLFDHVNEQTESVSGFGRLMDSYLFQQKVQKSLNFHHERNPITRRHKSDNFFNYEAIQSQQLFKGYIIGEKDILQGFLKSIDKVQTGYIGRSKNTQYGEVRFEITSDEPKDFSADVENFTMPTGNIFSLSLLSNTIIFNEHGFSTTDINDFKKYLSDLLGEDVQIKKAITKTGDIENFVSKWKLRKPSEFCFLAGSCFLLEMANPNYEKQKKMQQEGIGERRWEGFGRIIFGLQTKDNLSKQILTIDKPKRPKEKEVLPLPMTKNILKIIVKDYITRAIKNNAIMAAENFIKEKEKEKGLPTKTFIGRLENSVRKANDYASFKLEIIKIIERRPAKEKLERCHNGSINLLKFLTDRDFNEEISQIIENNDKLKILSEKEIQYEPDKDIDFKEELYKQYFSAFFSFMRWTLKK